ncbi:hypothetical protein KFL_003230060 [Klebsormidium nitens]|uniref:Uncharacterized protein n=1 Tax=Klebsormidium nitens TaxID=105231 RepID=A0A1Y1ICY3_KLENI|nr:hypothetical protein KFL_003230060 [Klebsormidium nitens]|eukprot:GAQ86961.1 hypothetical protein KFL_003230060 [Klebsormidium nitens]
MACLEFAARTTPCSVSALCRPQSRRSLHNQTQGFESLQHCCLLDKRGLSAARLTAAAAGHSCTIQATESKQRKKLSSRRLLLAATGFALSASGTVAKNAGVVAAASLDPSLNPSSGALGTQQLILPSPRETILQILEERGGIKNGGWGTLYAEKEVRERLDSAVTALLAANPTSNPGGKSVELGQGTWEVFHAPHITRMSSLLFGGTKFDPILYILNGGHIDSNVQYTAPLIGSGWLSAAGDFRGVDSERVEVFFDSFWVDRGADGLKPNPAGKGSWFVDGLNSAGRALFFPELSRFPVLYLDQDLVVFEFPPLRTKIAAARLSGT